MISWAVVFDIHLGHRRTPIAVTVKSIKRDIAIMVKKVSIIFFTGDVFDDLLRLPTNDAITSLMLIQWILNICRSNNVSIRVLEGTQSHDWEQSKLFMTLAGVDDDVKWVNKLEMEYVEKIGMNVLFIPDEWRNSHIDILKDARKCLADNNVSKVDLIFMHGTFEHVVPNGVNIPCHSPLDYSQLVKHWVYSGHIHTGGVDGKVHSGVSYERLIHGEEHPKGYLMCEFNNDVVTNVFVENKTAYPYKTITITGTLDVALNEISKLTRNMDFGHVLIKADKDHIVHVSKPIVRSINQLVRFTFNKTGKSKKEESTVEYAICAVNKGSIEDILSEHLRNTGTYSDEAMCVFRRYIKL